MHPATDLSAQVLELSECTYEEPSEDGVVDYGFVFLHKPTEDSPAICAFRSLISDKVLYSHKFDCCTSGTWVCVWYRGDRLQISEVCDQQQTVVDGGPQLRFNSVGRPSFTATYSFVGQKWTLEKRVK